jgi:hypothetical protein
MMWRRAKGREAKGREAEEREVEERDRQAQQEGREERNDQISPRSMMALRDPSLVAPQSADTSSGARWVSDSGSPPKGVPSPPLDVPVSAPDAVVVLDIRASRPGDAGQPVTLTIKRRELPVTPEGGETPESRLRKEMEDTVSAAAGEKIADRILPVQLPPDVAQVDLNCDLHNIMLGSLTDVPQFAAYAPVPGIDQSLDTVELALLVGGVLGAATGNPALSSVCFKSLAHRAIANAAEEAIEEAIKAAFANYEGLPPAQTGPAVIRLSSPAPDNRGDVSPVDTKSKSAGGPGI